MKIILPSEITLPSGKAGSHQHYWHFVMGNIVPLFDYIDDFAELSDLAFFDPGPFRHILICLGIRILDRETYLGLTRELIDESSLNRGRSRRRNSAITLVDQALYSHLPTCSLLSTRDPNIQCIRLQGLDHPTVYDHGKIWPAATKIMHYLDLEEKALDKDEDGAILFVNRGKPDAFYSSPHAHRKTAGTARRSIPNTAEIVSAIAKKWQVREVFLEGLDFKEQIRIFRDASIIVAQHGGGMTNLVWCRPHSTVVEINPYDLDNDWFRPLVEPQGIKHVRLRQNGEHGAVPPDAIVDLLTSIRRG